MEYPMGVAKTLQGWVDNLYIFIEGNSNLTFTI